MTIELRVLIGIPASGKSTFIKQEIENLREEHYTTCVISRDFVRQSLLTDRDGYFDKEVEVFNEFVRQINEAMELGIDIVFADATHINPASRTKLLNQLKPDPHTRLTFEVLNTPVEVAIKRNAQRTGFTKVPESAIKNMSEKFVIPSNKEFPKNKWGFANIRVSLREGE